MFGDNSTAITKSDGAKGGDILKSGYDVTQVKGTSKLRSQFTKALDFQPETAKEGALKEAAKQHGKYKGCAIMAQKVSDEKIAAGEAILQTYGVAMNHAEKAIGLEARWQKRTQQALEAISPHLLDMAVSQEQHAGFVEFCDAADKHLKF